MPSTLQFLSHSSVYSSLSFHPISEIHPQISKCLLNNSLNFLTQKTNIKFPKKIKCCSENQSKSKTTLKTCKNCKTQFDAALNHPLACKFHTAHFGGETKRKFESVYTGGTMNTPNCGQVLQYWHCCGSEDPFHPGCTSAPHSSYDD